ncbi:hypothetical protein QUF58_03540 [Anaerolineales bacterium HSG24]|nr:hypothetical protein [Anaerolineales bacterium HSG24]
MTKQIIQKEQPHLSIAVAIQPDSVLTVNFWLLTLLFFVASVFYFYSYWWQLWWRV